MDHSEKAKVQNTLDEFALTAQDIDVKAIGAKGDGSTDDKQAIQNAIQAASASASKRLVFTPGQYKLGRVQLQFPADVTVVFQQGATLLCTLQTQLSFDGVVKAGNYQIFKDIVSLKMKSVVAGNPMWFGAKGDGTTNDTNAFKTAFKFFNQLDVPYTEGGFVIESLETFRNMTLNGVGEKKPILIPTASTYKMFNVTTGGHFSVNNFEFRMANAPKYSSAFYFDTSKSYVEKVYITNCDFYDAYYVFTDARDKNVMMFMHFENILCKDSRFSTFDIEDFEGFIFMKNFTIDNSQSYTKHGIADGFIAIDIDDVRGCNFENMTLIGGNTGSKNEIGFSHPGRVAMMSALFWDNVTIKDMGGYGIVCGPGQGGLVILSTFVDVNILNCGGGIKMSGALEMQFERVLVDGNKQSPHKFDGITISNTAQTHLNNVVCKNNAGHGIKLNGATYSSLTDCRFVDNAGRGYIASGGSYNHLYDSTCTGNGEGQVSSAESSSLVTNVVYTDGKAGSLNGVGQLK